LDPCPDAATGPHALACEVLTLAKRIAPLAMDRLFWGAIPRLSRCEQLSERLLGSDQAFFGENYRPRALLLGSPNQALLVQPVHRLLGHALPRPRAPTVLKEVQVEQHQSRFVHFVRVVSHTKMLLLQKPQT